MERFDENGNWIENKSYTEIHRLHEMLEKANIPHTMKRFMDGWQICYPVEDPEIRDCDVVQHRWSYGHEENLLELLGLLTDEEQHEAGVAGFLTAKEVFSRIKKHWLNDKWELKEAE